MRVLFCPFRSLQARYLGRIGQLIPAQKTNHPASSVKRGAILYIAGKRVLFHLTLNFHNFVLGKVVCD